MTSTTTRLRRIGVAGVTLVALLAASAASAHGPGEAEGCVSTAAGIRPHLQGAGINVLDGDERLGIRNGTGITLVVLGYQGEPYLRFTPHLRLARTLLGRREAVPNPRQSRLPAPG
jgi:hypothetical protein